MAGDVRLVDRLRAVLRVYTLHDGILVGYLAMVLALVLGRASSTVDASACARRVALALLVTLFGAYFARAGFGGPKEVRTVVYRAGLVGVLISDYLMLRDLLPLVRPDTVDAKLYAIDLRVFGVEPALWLERFNRHAIVEWFSFFYFSYFWIVLLYMVVAVWLLPLGRKTTTFAIGIFIVFCVGQLGYMAVPGFGPVGYLAERFHAPLQGGFFWGCVTETVSAGSAMKDIFPSLHTAVPTFLTWYAVHLARSDRRWIPGAVVTGFFAANIIVSTMLLRWHFAIDVVAGLTLGSLAGWGAPRLAAAEERWRARIGLPAVWAFAASPASGPS